MEEQRIEEEKKNGHKTDAKGLYAALAGKLLSCNRSLPLFE